MFPPTISIITQTLAQISALLALLTPFGDSHALPPMPQLTPIVQTHETKPQAFRNDYADGPQIDGLFHWRRFPVRIYFDESGLYTPQRRQASLDGLKEWTAATNGAISYEITDTLRNADIAISFLPVRHIGQDRRAIGQTGTLMRRGSRMLYRAHIEIAAQGMETEFMTEVVAHEFGHALGINGHSDDENDLMYPFAKRYRSYFSDKEEMPKGPTERDLNTLRRAYNNAI